MHHKNRHPRRITIGLIVCLSVLFLTHGIRLQVGTATSDSSVLSPITTVTSGTLINVTGVLLMAPSTTTLQIWEQTIGAAKSLDFWLYTLSSPPIEKLLKGMARAGVPIRGILEDHPLGITGNVFAKIESTFSGPYAIALHPGSSLGVTFTHVKTFVTDSSFIIETANLDYSSFAKNREFFFVSSNPVIRENLESLFSKDRSGDQIKPSDIQPNLLICPIDCRAKTTALLSGAHHSIRMYQQYISDPAVLQQLEADSSLDLRFIVSDTAENKKLEASSLNADTHVMKSPYIHAKMILIDNTYLVLSSINLSSNAMDHNREIGIIIIDPGLIKQFTTEFLRDRSK